MRSWCSWAVGTALFATALFTTGCLGQLGDAPSLGGGGGGVGGGVPEGGAGGDPSVGGAGADGGGGDIGQGGAGGEVPSGPRCVVGITKGECLDLDACTNGGVSIPGHCDGSSEIQCCVHGPVTCDPEVPVYPNGGLIEAPGEGGCPAGMLAVGTFCVDRYEGSLETLDGFPWSPYFNPGNVEVRARSVEGAVPQGYISGIQAAAACANAGKRLCSNTEWLRACQGPDTTTYPYGDTLLPGVCNDARAEHPAIEYFGTSDDWIWSELGNACVGQLEDALDRTGANPGCITAEGAYDMMGNLHEWTSDPEGTFRGGFYVDTKINGAGCLYKTTAHTSTHWDYSTGFRCCADL